MTIETADSQVRETAARWAERLMDGDDLTATEREEFHRWVMANPAHEREYRAHTAILNRSRELPQDARDELLVLALASSRPRRSVWLGLAASLLLAVGVGGWFFHQSAATRHVTVAGMTHDITLPDGSLAHLNSRTELRWIGGADERRVVLLAGEALFEVRHDPAKPFTVVVDNSEVRVLGTRFNVRRRQSAEVVVTVLEGTVAVSQQPMRGSTQPAWTRKLHANEQVVYGAAGLVRDVYAATGANAARWREGILEFEDEPLANVVEDLGRYTDRQIVVNDARLAQLRLGGQLNVRGNLRDSIGLLEKLAPVTAHESAGTVVLDYRQDSIQEKQNAHSN